MADENPLFRTLKDSSNVAHAIDKINSGDAPGSKNGLLAFGFRDSAGNVVLPQLTAGGAIPVDSNAAMGTPIKIRGENAGSLSAVAVATLSLTADESYDDIHANVSCLRETLFQLVQIDDATETVLADALVGAGQYSFHFDLGCVSITAGSTGTQSLVVRGINLDKISTMRANVCAYQAA
jgi:hypothetical protein